MPEENQVTETGGKSIKEAVSGFFNAIKTPVFYIAIGYVTCKFLDRKKRTVV